MDSFVCVRGTVTFGRRMLAGVIAGIVAGRHILHRRGPLGL